VVAVAAVAVAVVELVAVVQAAPARRLLGLPAQEVATVTTVTTVIPPSEVPALVLEDRPLVAVVHLLLVPEQVLLTRAGHGITAPRTRSSTTPTPLT